MECYIIRQKRYVTTERTTKSFCENYFFGKTSKEKYEKS
jgi:hypothetical protein